MEEKGHRNLVAVRKHVLVDDLMTWGSNALPPRK